MSLIQVYTEDQEFIIEESNDYEFISQNEEWQKRNDYLLTKGLYKSYADAENMRVLYFKSQMECFGWLEFFFVEDKE